MRLGPGSDSANRIAMMDFDYVIVGGGAVHARGYLSGPG
jgi:translation initiation factor 2B subunit (eIF-2B alpha/beta/delta family)